MRILLCLLFVVFLWPRSSASAHDPPNEEIRELSVLIQRSAPSADLLHQRAELWLQEGYADEAATDLTLARTLSGDVDRVRAAILWAEVWRQRGRLAEAEAELDPAVAQGSLEALVVRAKIRAEAGRWRDALADYDAALARRATVELALGRGRALEALGQWERAAEGYGRDASRLGGAVVLRLAHVAALRRMGHWNEAVAVLDAVIAQARAKTRWLLLRADVLAQAGRLDAARRDRLAALREAERVLERRRSPAARMAHGQALLALGRLDEARRELVRVRNASPPLAAAASELLDAMGGAR